MDFLRIKKIPLWIEEIDKKPTWFQRFRSRFIAELPFFYAFVEEWKKQMIVYLVYDNETGKYFIDIPHGYLPRFDSPDMRMQFESPKHRIETK